MTSSSVVIGNMANIMDPDEKGTAALFIDRPLITNEEMEVIKHLESSQLKPVVLSLLYPAAAARWRRRSMSFSQPRLLR